MTTNTPKPSILDNKTKSDRLADKDPVFKDDVTTDDDLKTDMDRAYDEPVNNESWQSMVARFNDGEVVNDPHEGDIVYHEQLGNGRLKTHGPMSRKDWTAYSLENNL